MAKAIIHRSSGFEGQPLTLLDRINGLAGVPIGQADVGSIQYTCTELDSGEEVATRALTVADVVFDALQADDPRWDVDAAGFNFEYTAPGSDFPSGGTTYRIEILFTPPAPNADQAFFVVHQHTTIEILSD